VYLGFRGGKGVATGAGVFLAVCPLALLAAAGVFGVFLWRWRMVSLGSVVSSLSLPLWVALLSQPAETKPLVALALGVAVLSVWKHRSNIQRIFAGTESKFGSRV
jgi:glycerol-3-phosphate acyltransferase PlsY